MFPELVIGVSLKTVEGIAHIFLDEGILAVHMVPGVAVSDLGYMKALIVLEQIVYIGIRYEVVRLVDFSRGDNIEYVTDIVGFEVSSQLLEL